MIIPNKDDNKKQRRALLLPCARPLVQDIFHVLSCIGDAMDYLKPEDALTRHFVIQINTPYMSGIYSVQGEDETIDHSVCSATEEESSAV